MTARVLTWLFRYLRWRRGAVSPLWVTFDVTWNCNCRCEYCNYWKDEHEDLSLDRVRTVIDNLADLGAVYLGISGGEPLLRRDIVEIVSHAKRRGMYVGINTNGMIRKDEVFRDLMRSGLDTLCFSLDGARAETHEHFRKQCPFDRVVGSIRRAVEIRNEGGHPTRISTNTVIHRGNVHELSEVARLRADMGADRNNFQPVVTASLNPETGARIGFRADDLELLEQTRTQLKSLPDGNLSGFVDLLVDTYSPGGGSARKLECFAGRSFVYVDPRGQLYPCSVLRDSLADLTLPGASARLGGEGVRAILHKAARQQCTGCSLVCYMERNVILNRVMSPRMWYELAFRRGYLKRLRDGDRAERKT